MKKRNTFKKIAVLCLSIAFTLSAAACGEGLITTNSEKDMAQVIATVNIADHDDFKGDGEYAAYADVIKSMNKDILKRDLVAYFLNVGYTYINSYGYTYEQTFNTLMDTLVSRKIMVQYAMAYYFSTESDVYTVEGYNAYIESEQAKITDETEKKLYADHPEILTMKYFLTNGGKTAAEDTADYDRAVYSLKKMINNTLDSSEQNYITEEDDEDDDTSAESRTTPTAWVRRRKTTTTSITRFIPAATRRTAAALTNGSTVRRSVPAVWRTIISSPICRATAFSAIRKTPRTSRNSIIILSSFPASSNRRSSINITTI